MALLPNTHVSPETAYVVDDYPYGFKLRCKVRYWLETDPKRGTRLVSQTTNPKRPGEVWNQPKRGTYHRFGAALFLDDEGRVRCAGLSEYADGAEATAFWEAYGAGVPDAIRDLTQRWVRAKVAYDAQRAAGCDPRSAAIVAQAAFVAKPTE